MVKLLPFSSDTFTENFSVHAQLTQASEAIWQVEFRLRGNLKDIYWPEAPSSGRHHELWRSTCFELFSTPSKQEDSAYIEVNVSPGGAWNTYEFSGYRQGMKESQLINISKASFEKTEHLALMSFAIEGLAFSPASVGLCCVIKSSDGGIHYWALHHPSNQADFHNQKAWKAPSALQ